MQKDNIENLELKLLQTKKENAEKLDKIESEFNEKYSDFFDVVLNNDNLSFKRYISVNFQLEKLDNPNKSYSEILKNSISSALSILPINQDKKKKLEQNLLLLLKNKKLDNVLLKNIDLRKDKNYPILDDLKKYGVLDDNDLIQVGLKFKETHSFLDSISVLSDEKREIIKQNYFELNNTKTDDRIKSFENDFSSEIKNSKLLKVYPKVLKFIGKNYFKLRIKNKLESKKDRLRRLYKIAFLKLYRLKYSGIDIDKLLKKIDSISDFDEFINLIIKYFEVLKQNPVLQKDYIVSEQLDDVENILNESENNKQKILFSEKNTIKVNEIFEKTDKNLTKNELDELLGDDVDLVGNEFLRRIPVKSLPSPPLEGGTSLVGAYNEENLKNNKLEKEKQEEEELKEIDLERYYEELKNKYEQLEKKKLKIFLQGDYDLLDELNEDLLKLYIKIEKLQKLLGFDDNSET